MILKIVGLGIVDYVRDSFNVFDGIVVIVSCLEFLISSESTGFSVLRGFRLLRIFKIVRSWTSLQLVLQTVLQSLPSTANLGALVFLFMFVYALIGKQFFSGVMYDTDGEVSRYNFNNMGSALTTMFVVLTGENWNEIM